jgi:integrase
MARPALPLGGHGRITTWREGARFVARAQFRDYDGVVRFVKRNGRTKAAAERALREALTERQAPVKAASVSPTTKVSVVAEMWLREVERLVDAGGRSPGTFNAYRSIYRRQVDPALRALRIREVTTPMVDRMLAQIKVRSVSNARTSRLVTAGLMRFAARQGAIVVNPVREVAQIEGTPRRRPRALTGEERQAWLAALESSQKAQDWDLPDLIRFLLATGCRIGEALAVGWDDVDLGEGTVEIRSRLVRRSGVGLLRLPSTKSGRQGERLVPLPGWAVEMLRERRAAIGEELLAVFPRATGSWRDPSNVLRVWREMRDELQMDGLVSHTMRKTVASIPDDAQVSTRKISDQLGHSRVSMTQDAYLGRRLTDRQTAEVLEGLLGPNRKVSE